MRPYTVVMDWSGDFAADDPVVFRVYAYSASDAYRKAEARACREYGENADALYGVITFEGHPTIATD